MRSLEARAFYFCLACLKHYFPLELFILASFPSLRRLFGFDPLLACFLLPNIAVYATGQFISLFAQDLGFSYWEIGLVSASFYLGSMLSYFLFGRLSDVTGRKTMLVKIGFVISAVLFSAQFFINDFSSFFVLRFVAGFAMGVYSFPLFAIAAVKKDYRQEIGLTGALGQLGSFFGAAFAALIGDVRLLFAFSGVFFVFSLFASLKIARVRIVRVKVPKIPLAMLWKNRAVYTAYFLRHTGANAAWVVFPIFLRGLGASLFWIGAISAFNLLLQYFFMKKIGELAQKGRLDDKKLAAGGAIATALAFALVIFIPHFAFAFLFMAIIAAAYSMLYTGSMFYVASRNPEKASSASILGTIISLSTVVGMVAGGVVSQWFGIPGAFAFAVILSLSAMVVSQKM